MRQIYGYGNMRKVVGIQSTSSAYYHNNRYYRRQQERENAREQRKQKEFILKKPQLTNEVAKTYKSEDAKIIYFMEYCKVRNTKIYGQLNPNVNTNIIDYSSRYPQYTSSNSTNVNRMLEAYNQMNKNKNVIVDFEKRKSTSSKPVEKQEVKTIMSKKEEMDKFKQSLKRQEKTDLDIAAEKFEKALREKNKYEAELRKNGYRVIKGRNSGFER